MKRQTVMLAGVLIGAPFLTGNLMAAEWEKSAGISLGTEFSDNMCLSDKDQISDNFATVTPDIRVSGRGARASVSLAGSLQYNSLGESDLNCFSGVNTRAANRETWLPNLRYRGDLELVEDWLTLESDATAQTTNIDPFAAGSANSLDGRDNVNVVYQYGAGARIQRRLFNSANMLMRYNYNEQVNGVTQLGDSSENLGEFDLNTEGGNSRLAVGVSGRYSEVTYQGNINEPAFDNRLSSAEARASLQLSTSWQTNALVGKEWNEFTSSDPDIDGSYWDAGLRWSPNDRVEVGIGTGQRFFGSTPRMNIRYRHKRSELSADYSRSLTLPRNLRAASGGFDDPFDPGFDTGNGGIPDVSPTVSGESTFIGNKPLINERLSLRYSYSTTRSTISLTGSNSKQKRLEDLTEATFSSLGLALSRSMTSRLSASMSVTWSEQDGQGGTVGALSEPSESWFATLGLNRRLGSSTTMSMRYQHNLRESDAVLNEYTENRITLSARHEF